MKLGMIGLPTRPRMRSFLDPKPMANWVFWTKTLPVETTRTGARRWRWRGQDAAPDYPSAFLAAFHNASISASVDRSGVLPAAASARSM
jgi:hypothetical protein